MTVAERVYDRVREREREHPGFVGEVLLALAEPDHVLDADEGHRRLAATLVDERAARDLAEFRRRALTTRQVVDRIVGIGDRRSVEARRRRGGLLGLTVAGDAYHPDWQLAAGRTRPRLREVLAVLLPAAGGEPVVADVIMRAHRDELDGASLAELYAAGRTDEVLAHLQQRGEGFTP